MTNYLLITSRTLWKTYLTNQYDNKYNIVLAIRKNFWKLYRKLDIYFTNHSVTIPSCVLPSVFISTERTGPKPGRKRKGEKERQQDFQILFAFALEKVNKHEQQSHRNGEIHREENFGEVRRNAVVTAWERLATEKGVWWPHTHRRERQGNLKGGERNQRPDV